jgi:hypothetical protein
MATYSAVSNNESNSTIAIINNDNLLVIKEFFWIYVITSKKSMDIKM